MTKPTAKLASKILIKNTKAMIDRANCTNTILSLNGKCIDSDSPCLLKTCTSFDKVGSVDFGEKEMLFNLASIYGTRVKDANMPHPLLYVIETNPHKGMAIQVSTFQKLSLFNLDLPTLLISMLCYFWFKIDNYIVPKLSSAYKGIMLICLSFLFILCVNCVYASGKFDSPENGLKELIMMHEKQNNIPPGLLVAIAKVESDISPFALNINGKPVFQNNQEQAICKIKEALAEGITNIDVGVMQLNVKWHQDNFTSIEEMLDPKKNIEYAANFLLKLHKKYDDWHKAVRFYHSSTAEHYRKYSKKVTLAWIGE
jgi:Transglycosylase SLT domain